MKIFALIFLIGFLWITRDIIRVPETFNNSFFAQFKGNQFVDPQVSWTNQYILGEFLSPLISSFSDLFHLLGTCVLGIFFFMIIKRWEFKTSWKPFWIWVFMFVCFGVGNFAGWGLWRKLLINLIL